MSRGSAKRTCISESHTINSKLELTLKRKSLNREQDMSLASSTKYFNLGEERKTVAMAQQKQIITILSIDGGGIRGIIPASLLCSLEEQLQKIDGKNARIADYFDVVAGTSTGSLIAALLVAPEEGSGRPRSASQIIDFYKKSGPQIFSQEAEIAQQAAKKLGKAPKWWHCCGICRKLCHCTRKQITVGVKMVTEAKYDRKHLDEQVNEILGGLKLSNIPRSIVIPAFDLKAKAPVVFSNKQSMNGHEHIKLAHAVISSCSAPFFFPSHKFNAEEHDHELIDGGIAANNPILLAIGEARKEYPDQSESFGCYRILSLGTGTLEAKDAPNLPIGSGGVLDLFWPGGGTPPLVDMMFRANEVITDMYTSTVLGRFNQFPHYLRIQDYKLKKELNSMNKATPEQISKLQKAAGYLLNMPVSVANACTGLQEPLKGPGAPANNRDALVK